MHVQGSNVREGFEAQDGPLAEATRLCIGHSLPTGILTADAYIVHEILGQNWHILNELCTLMDR
jgi:hypothetical protein